MENYYLINHGTLSEIADSIREKRGISDELQVSDFAEQISSIEGSSIEYESVSVNIKNGSAERIWIQYTAIGSSDLPEETSISIDSGKNSTIKALNYTSVYVCSANLVTPITVSKSMGTGNTVFKYDAVGSMYALKLTTTNATSLIVGGNSAALTATADKVLKGTTFVGTSGYGVGTLETSEGSNIQAYKNYIEGVISADEMLNMTSASITTVAPYVFYGNDFITSLSLPECTELGEGSFTGCSNLTEINLPKCTTLNCQALGIGWNEYEGVSIGYRDPEATVINFPKIEYIYPNALQSLTIADANDLKNVVLLDQVYEVICDNYPNTVELPKVLGFYQGWNHVFSNVINLYMPNCNTCYYDEYGSLTSSLSFSKLKVLTLGLEYYCYYQFNYCSVLRELTLTGSVPLYFDYYEGSHSYETDASYVFPSILRNSGVVRVPDDQYDDYLNYSPWNQVHLVPISEKGSVSLLNQCTITENFVKTFVVAHAYGWDFDTLNITYSIDDNSAEVREVFVDKDSHEISIKVFGKTPGFSTVQLTLRDEANEPYAINIDIKVVSFDETFSIIDLWHTGEYGFEFEGDENTLISNNSNVDNTTAETRIDFNAPYDGTLYLDWYIESESCCDKGSISTLDTQTYPTEWVFAGNSAGGPRTGTVSMEVSPGEHSIYLKYRKDGSASYGIDAFRVTFRFE